MKTKSKSVARASLKEEREAIGKYQTRAKTASGGLRRVIKHNLSEEREHAAALKPYAGRKK